MQQVDYDKLKAQAKARAEERIALAKAEYERDIEAIERVWVMFLNADDTEEGPEEDADELSSDEPKDESREPGNLQVHFDRGELLEMVRTATRHYQGTFTVISVQQVLTRSFPGRVLRQSSIAAALRRLYELGELQVVQTGIGRRPTAYAYAQHQEPNQEGANE